MDEWNIGDPDGMDHGARLDMILIAVRMQLHSSHRLLQFRARFTLVQFQDLEPYASLKRALVQGGFDATRLRSSTSLPHDKSM
jgi:hypothetical protein